MLAVLDIFLRVVPRAAAGSHGDRDEQTGDDGSQQHRPHRGERRRLPREQVDEEIDDDGREHRQHRRNHHFLDGGFRQQVHGAAVFGLCRPLHDAGYLPELAADLDDHGAARAAHGHHAESAEQIGQQAADEQTDHHPGVLEAELHRDIGEVMAQVLGVGGEKHECRQRRRADGVTLGHRLGGVADRVERIGGLADVFRQVGHFGDAAGVVGHRAVGVERHHHAGERQHGRRRDGEAEQARRGEGDDDTGGNHHDRQRAGFHRHGQALNDVGGVTRLRRARDAAHGAERGRSVVFGDPHQQAGHRQPDENADVERAAGNRALARHIHGVETDPCADDDGDEHGGQHRRPHKPLVERRHNVAPAAEADQQGAGDGSENAGAADDERELHHRRLLFAGEEDAREQHRRHHGYGIGFEQVGRHARAIAHIVADIVGDHRGVARVVLGDAGFDLADQVGADIGALGENAAAEPREDGDQRRAEGKRDERLQHAAQGLRRVDAEERNHRRVVAGNAEQAEADHQQAGDCARPEGDGQRRREAPARRLRGAQVGAHGHVHADIARSAREHGADRETDGDMRPQQAPEQQRRRHADAGDGRILAVQIGARALLDGGGNFAHPLVPAARRHHPADSDGAVQHGGRAAGEREHQRIRHDGNPVWRLQNRLRRGVRARVGQRDHARTRARGQSGNGAGDATRSPRRASGVGTGRRRLPRRAVARLHSDPSVLRPAKPSNNPSRRAIRSRRSEMLF